MTDIREEMKLRVTLPDGTTATRTTNKTYTHVCAFRITDVSGEIHEWGAQWSTSQRGAKSAAKRWQTCPATKIGSISVETKILEVEFSEEAQ